MQKTSTSFKPQKTLNVDKGIEEELRETLSLPICLLHHHQNVEKAMKQVKVLLSFNDLIT